MQLYGAVTGNCLRVAIALEEAGLPYKPVLLDLRGGEQSQPAHLARNPAGKVPTLVVHAQDAPPLVLSQSNAILLHLAETSGALLLPNDPAARALALERFFYFVTDVIAPSHGGFFLRGKGEAAGADMLDTRSREALLFAERFVAAAPYMAGERFTLADIAALTIAAAHRQQLDWAAVPALKAWFERMMQRPAVQRGLRAFDPPVPA
jgi:GST-like protein